MVARYETRHLINGEWMASGDATVPVHDPSTGTVLADVPVADDEVVGRAVSAARDAMAQWGRTVPRDRAAMLLSLADAVDSHGEDLAALESLNVGKPLAYAREEIPLCSDILRYFAGACRSMPGHDAGEFMADHTSMVRREPIGVAGLITPWNYPLLEACWKIAPALAAGNTAVLKPSELTPLTTLVLGELSRGILPPGVLNIVAGPGSTGERIVRHPDVRVVSMTGDVSTGKKVAAAAAETLTRVHLELGGKAPVLVFDDVDPVAVAQQLVPAGFVNSGQDCTAACRIIVHASIYDDFAAAYAEAAAKLSVGNPMDPGTELGPVVSLRQQQRVLGFLERARAAGADVLTGGSAMGEAGYFIEPTVVVGVRQDSEIIQNEVFGPVVTLQRAANDDDMLAMANDSRYGLSASVWTSHIGRTLRTARELRYGTVWVNEHLPTPAEIPFGGFADSGYGKELSTHAIDEFSQFKHVMVKLS